MARRRRNFTYGGRRVYNQRTYNARMANRSRSGRSGGMSLGLTTEFLIGAAIGLTNLDNSIPAPLKLGVACAPIRGIGKIKGFAQGLVIGDLVQNLTGITMGGGSSGSASSGGAW